jgi:hypothetical protein
MTSSIPGEIRPFAREDVPKVAELWLRSVTIRHGTGPAETALERLGAYFDKFYFENPWTEEKLPSYVLEHGNGQIGGFIGLTPRRLLLDGRPILAAVSSGIAVDPGLRRNGVGLALRQRSFEGPQQLLFTDGASAAGRRLWEHAGGTRCLLYGAVWTRSLRPCGQALGKAMRRWGRPVKILAPVSRLIDAALIRSSFRTYRLPPHATRCIDGSAEDLIALRTRFEAQPALARIYESAELDWILKETALATNRGILETRIVQDGHGEPIGWYVYFAKSGGVSEVMQIGAAPARMGDVFSDLCHVARQAGATGISGQMDARYLDALIDAGCKFHFPCSFYLHSTNARILQAIHSGDTNLSRLDGEWWTRYADGPW